MATIKLGELLVKANVLQESQLKAALAEQQKWGGRLGDILVRMSLVTEDLLIRALSKQMAIPAANLDAIQGIPPHVKSKVPANMARDLGVLPLQLRDEGKTLVVAMTEPQNVRHLDTLRAVTKCRIVAQLTGRTALARAFARFYEGEADISDFEGSFKVVDAQGRTVVKSIRDVEEEGEQQAAPPPPAATGPRPAATGARPVAAAAPRPAATGARPAATGARPIAAPMPPPVAAAPTNSAADMLRTVEEVQRKEVSAIKAMVELLIEKGVFTRDEYLAKVKR